ncbi:MAG: hypothetical protein ACYTG0_38055 [Planctomycetota bacterium]|jgi:hypothetical protein
MFNMVLFLYLPLMLGSLLWNGVACLLVFRNRRLDSRRFRYLHYLVLLLMLPGVVCDVGGMSPDAAILPRAAWLYPGVFFLAAMATYMCYNNGKCRHIKATITEPLLAKHREGRMKNNREYGLLLTATFMFLCSPEIAWPDEKQRSSSSPTLLSVSESKLHQESKRMIGFLIMGGNLDTHQRQGQGGRL